MSAPVIIDDRKRPATVSLWRLITEALDAGSPVQLRPGVPGGFVLVRNGPALLATDFDGTPRGTFLNTGSAIDAWYVLQGKR